MRVTLTINDILDAVDERLRASADAHRRSMTSEAIVNLKTVRLPLRANPDELLGLIRKLRASLSFTVTAEGVDTLKREGRP